MSRRVIIVSPPGERLTLRSDGMLNAEPHPEEGYSTVIVQGPAAQVPEAAGSRPPPPPPDITMTFVSGLPAGLEPERLARAPVVHGPVSVGRIHDHLPEPSKGLADIVVLRSGGG